MLHQLHQLPLLQFLLLPGKTVAYRSSGWSLYPRVSPNELCCYMPVSLWSARQGCISRGHRKAHNNRMHQQSCVTWSASDAHDESRTSIAEHRTDEESNHARI